MSSFLQSQEWAEFQKSLGRKVFYIETENIVATLFESKLAPGKHYLYIPFGPIINFDGMTGGIKNEVASFISKLKSLTQEQKSVFIKIEPQVGSVAEVMTVSGFKKPHKETTPHKTVMINIDRELEIILASVHHKTRYNIGLAERKGIEVRESSDVMAFAELVKETAQRNRKTYPLYSPGYYKMFLDFFSGNSESLRAKMFLAHKDQEAIAGAIILINGETACYMYGGSSRKYAPFMAPYLLHWEIIKKMKEMGLKNYDMWGIDPKRWPGITRFKLGWGGKTVEYPGSFDLPISKFWYLIYQVYRAVFKFND